MHHSERFVLSLPPQLWALLHFIMPTLFDSHEEFNEWFSKDIENHAENKSAIDQGKKKTHSATFQMNELFFIKLNQLIFIPMFVFQINCQDFI